MKLLLYLLTFSLFGCTTPQTRALRDTQGDKFPICFVRWKNPIDKDKHLKGLGLTREEKSKKNLLFPIWKNGGVIVRSRLEKGYAVVFDISETGQSSYVSNIVNQNFFSTPELMQQLLTITWKIEERDFLTIIKDHEQVDCKDFSEFQVL